MAVQDKNFLGMDGFVWWFGIVESRQDPLSLGRVQVRIYGWHSHSLSDIPTDDLPWASVIHAPNERAFATPREADAVFGFFADGRNGQFPVVMGIVPGYFTQAPNTGEGFNDLRSQDTLKTAPKHPVSRTYKTDGSGIEITEINTGDTSALESLRHPNADELGHDSITGVTRYQNLANTVIAARKNNLDEDVKTAGGVQWSEPYPAYNPLYPYNQANETESGHVFELDDTPGNERIHLAHRSGSFVEWYPTGTVVEKVTKSKYQIVMGEDHLHVMGRVLITVDSDALIRVAGDVALEVGGKMTANAAGDIDIVSGGNFNVKATNINMAASSDATVISATQHLTGTSSVDITSGATSVGSSGDLNFLAGGNANLQGGSGAYLTGSIAVVQGSTIGLTGHVLAKGISPGSIPGGSATSAASGSAATLGSPVSGLTKTTGEPEPEEIPVPLSSKIDFDPYTGIAYKQQQFLESDANNKTVTPDSNTANIGTQNCNFDVQSHTFISDSSSWSIGDAGINIIKASEGYAKVISGTSNVRGYPDPATGSEPITIGYGTTGPAVGQTITLGTIISQATAEQYLTDSINKKFMVTLRQTITVPLTQNMIDACISLMYNIGQGNFTKSTLRKRINAQDWCGAADAFLVWNKAAGKVVSGLTTRRKKERALFLR